MKSINLNNGSIDIPASWEDLSFSNKHFAFKTLMELSSGSIDPVTARKRLFKKFTNYKPSIKDPEAREIIELNLTNLSETIDFIFTIDNNRIIPCTRFLKNPVEYITIGRKRYPGRKFNIGITAQTDITAREFSDCFDLLSAYSLQPTAYSLLDQLVSILYPSAPYRENLVSDHANKIWNLDPILKFGIMTWFSGIVDFYAKHPLYSILMRPNKNDDEEKISLGMHEVFLFVKREGYADGPDMNLNDFFDAQLKSLKDTISHAIAEGAKPEDLATSTGLDLTTILKLS